MALTSEQRRKAARQFIRLVYKQPNVTAEVDVPTIFQAADEINAWFDASPVGDVAATRIASINAAVNATFIGNTTGAQLASMVALTINVRAGLL